MLCQKARILRQQRLFGKERKCRRINEDGILGRDRLPSAESVGGSIITTIRE